MMGRLADRIALVVPFAGRERWDRKMRWMEKALVAIPSADLVMVGLLEADFAQIRERLEGVGKERIHGVYRVGEAFVVRSAAMIEAVREGLLWSFSEGAVAGCSWDAEGEVDVADLVEILRLLRGTRGVDHVMAARLRLLGRDIKRPLVQLYYERILATGISLALDIATYDTLCFTQAFLPSAAVLQALEKPFVCTLLWQSEILLRLAYQVEETGRKTLEYPLRRWEAQGYSGLFAQHFPQVVWEMGLLARGMHTHRRGK